MLITIAISMVVIALVAYWKWDSLDQLKDVAYLVGCVIAVSAVTGWILSERVQTLQARADEAEQNEAKARTAENERQTAQANEAAAKAHEGLAKANERQEEIRKENLELSLKLETERSGRAALEMSLKQRLFPYWGAPDALGIFKGTEFLLVSVRDAEAKAAAMSLGVTLEQAGWKAVKWTNTDLELGSGIMVEAQEPAPNPEDRSLQARDSLVEWLNKNKVFAHPLSAARAVPPNTVRITVGRSERLGPPAKIVVKYETILNKGPDEPPSPEEFW